MRIAYIAPYQGPSLLKVRPVVGNLSLAGSVKVELIAGLLNAKNHQVEIISQGEVVELKCKWYPSFRESEPFHPDIPIYYASALPVRFLNGVWSSMRTLDLFKARHRVSPYDMVVIYNLKQPQIACAYAFVDLAGRSAIEFGLADRLTGLDPSSLLTVVSGCMAASPHLLSQLPSNIPKLLLRGIVGHDILEFGEQAKAIKKNWVLFSGTFHKVKGIEQLIRAWHMLKLPDWELHITGQGDLTSTLQQMTYNNRGIVFHGLVDRQELVRLMCSAKVCVNPHDASQTPGNIFSFKIIEYLAAGAHVISTPMGPLEKEIESGMTYMHDNNPETIVAALKQVIFGATWKRTARQYVLDMYGPQLLLKTLDKFLQQASAHHCSTRDGAEC
jgi:glycosyltransferase involved in cell wall biosynthesis